MSKALLMEALSNIDSKVMTDEMKSQISEAFETAVTKEAEQKVKSLEESFEAKIEEFSKVIVESVITDQKETFEKAVASKAVEISEEHKKQLDEALEKQYEENLQELVESLDEMATQIAKDFMEENRVAIVDQLQVEKASSIVESFADFAETFGANLDKITKDESDEMKELQESLSKLEEKNKLQEAEILLNKMEKIRESATAELSELQRKKVYDLTESVDFVDEEQYKEKIDTYVALFSKSSDSFEKEKLKESEDKSKPGNYTPSWKK